MPKECHIYPENGQIFDKTPKIAQYCPWKCLNLPACDGNFRVDIMPKAMLAYSGWPYLLRGRVRPRPLLLKRRGSGWRRVLVLGGVLLAKV